MVSYEYAEKVSTITRSKERMRNKYMENRKNISIVTDTYEKLIEIRKDMELKSLTDAINELIAIKEKVVTGKSFKCKKCGQSVEIFSGTKPEKIGLIHSHVANTDCPGCIKMSYTLKDKANGTTESNDNKSEQTDAKDEVTKVRFVNGRKLETIGNWEYIDGKKVITYIGGDLNQPKTDEDAEREKKERYGEYAI